VFSAVVTLETMAPGTHGHNIIVRVLEKNIALERKAGNGPALRIEECLVADKSGCMLLTAKNGALSHVA
jgi:replication factor A1